MAGSVTVRGRLAADPEARITPNGKTAASFTVVANHRKKNPDTGKFEDDGNPDYYRITTWGKDAEHVTDNFRKGDLVILTGTLRHSQYAKRDGGTGYALEVDADWDSIGLVRPAAPRNTPNITTEDDPWN